MKKLKKISLLIFLSSCDFTSEIHKNILLAQEKVKRQEYDQALVIYDNVIKRDLESNIKAKILFQVAEIYTLYKGDYENAAINYEKIIHETDESMLGAKISALEQLADIHFTFTQNYPKSLKYYSLLMNFEFIKNRDLYQYKIAESYFNLNDFTNAKEIYLQIHKDKLHKYYTDSLERLATINFYQKNFDEAINQWKEYIKREKRKDKIIKAKFMIANAYESNEELKKAYNIYYSILGEHPRPEIIRQRLRSLYNRRIARKR